MMEDADKPLTPRALMEEIMYASYKANRDASPEISPRSWAQVLPNVPAMEERYQAEKNAP